MGGALSKSLWSALLVLVAFFALGCAPADPEVVISQWTLDVDGKAPRTIDLPSHLEDLVTPNQAYRLRATVDVPSTTREQQVVLRIPFFAAVTSLVVDGSPIAALEAEPRDAIRTRGPHAWLLPRLEGKHTLEIVVLHRWQPSAWIDTAPRLVVLAEGASPSRPGISDAGAIVALGALVPLGLAFFTLWLLERSRKAYVWFSAEAMTGTVYALYTLGLTERWLGRSELAVFAFSQVLSPYAGARFALATLDLKEPRILRWTPVAALVVAAAGFISFHEVLLGWVVVALDSVVLGYLFLALAPLRRHRELGPRMQLLLIAGFFFIISLSTEGPWWLGQGVLFGGARFACFALVGLAVAQTAILSREYSQMFRRAGALNEALASRVEELETRGREIELLNVELRHQVTARSRQIAELLARLETARAPAGPLNEGDVVDARYRVDAPIGSGAMGAVYRVTRLTDQVVFALKVMTRVSGPRAAARFAREAELASRINHTNVVRIVDIHVADAGFLYIVFEHIDGPALSGLRNHFGERDWALGVLLQIARALDAIHVAGIVHRDLKPANVLVASNGPEAARVKITDFGLSRRWDEEEEESDDQPLPSASPRSRPSPDLTATGDLLGTPLYMAPELEEGSEARTSSDIFGLGLMAFELLTAKHPRRDRDKRSLAEACPDLPAALLAVLARCVDVDPLRRPTASEIVTSFEP